MFFEDDDKDTSRSMDDHDLDFESEDSVSWDKLLEETDAEQPQATVEQASGELLMSGDQAFDSLVIEEPVDVNQGVGILPLGDSDADTTSNAYTFELAMDEPADVNNATPGSEYDQPVIVDESYDSRGLDIQSAPAYQAPAPDEEYDVAGYEYEEEAPSASRQPQRKIPGGSFAENNNQQSAPPKKDNAALLGVTAALALIILVAIVIFVMLPVIRGVDTGSADDLLAAETPIEQDIAAEGDVTLPGDDSVALPPDDAQAPVADASAQPAPDAAAQAPEKPGVSKKVEDKVDAKKPKTAKAEPGRNKVVLPVVGTGRSNPFTPIVKYNSFGFIVKPNINIPEPPTDLGNLTETLEKLQTITVSGILYDSVKPSAIIKVSGVDYFVQKGDRVDSYIVAEVTQTTVVLKEGQNSYRASIGQSFSSVNSIGGQVNVGNTRQTQYVSARDIGVGINTGQPLVQSY